MHQKNGEVGSTFPLIFIQPTGEALVNKLKMLLMKEVDLKEKLIGDEILSLARLPAERMWVDLLTK